MTQRRMGSSLVARAGHISLEELCREIDRLWVEVSPYFEQILFHPGPVIGVTFQIGFTLGVNGYTLRDRKYLKLAVEGDATVPGSSLAVQLIHVSKGSIFSGTTGVVPVGRAGFVTETVTTSGLGGIKALTTDEVVASATVVGGFENITISVTYEEFVPYLSN